MKDRKLLLFLIILSQVYYVGMIFQRHALIKALEAPTLATQTPHLGWYDTNAIEVGQKWEFSESSLVWTTTVTRVDSTNHLVWGDYHEPAENEESFRACWRKLP